MANVRYDIKENAAVLPPLMWEILAPSAESEELPLVGSTLKRLGHSQKSVNSEKETESICKLIFAYCISNQMHICKLLNKIHKRFFS